MKARRRTLFQSILILGLLGTLLIVYLHFGLCPGRLKPIAVKTINDFTQTHVDFDKILILPFEGVSLHRLTVRDKNGNPLFSTKKISVNMRLIPFFKEKRIIISNVVLENPLYTLVLEPAKDVAAKPPRMTQISGQIPVPVVSDKKELGLETLEEGPEFFLPENVSLEQIEITNGSVNVKKKPGDPVAEEIRSVNIRMTFQKPPDLVFDGFLKLGRLPYAEISLEGAWNLKTGVHAFHLQTRSNQVPDWLLAYQKDHFLILKSGRVMLETYLSSTAEGKTFFRSQAKLYDSLINVRGAAYSGRMDINAKGLFDTDTKTFDRYIGSLDFVDVNVKNLSEKIPELKNLHGKISFKPDLLTIDGITGHYRSLAFKAYGTLQSFKELALDATIHTDSKISEILAILSEEQKKLIGRLQISGDCQAVTTVRGTLKNPKTMAADHKILVRHGSITSPDKKINLSKIDAQLSAGESGFQISRCNFIAGEKTYSLNASIPKLSSAPHTCDLHSKDFDLAAVYTLDSPQLLVKEAVFKSNALSSTFHGRISNPSDPVVDIEGNADIFLGRTKTLAASYAPALGDADLNGTLSGAFRLKGAWNKPLLWTLSAKAAGDPVFIKKNIRLDKFAIQFHMKNRMIDIPYLHAQCYRGTLSANLRLDLSKPEMPYKGKIFADKVDLKTMARDIKIKETDFAGLAVFQIMAEGDLKSPKNAVGEGSLSIRNGRLWKTDLFKAMGKLPFLKVEGLDFVTFHDLTTTFNVHGQRVWTQNLDLSSDPIDLSLKGSVGFDQTLDLVMDIQYSNSVLLGAMDTGGLAPFIVRQAGDFISQYRISGTLKEPKYEKAGLPIGRVIGKKISNLLGA
ncbi:MAG: hypothetical protein COT00_01310 [Candidatus Omnitrophica bacterium CG07_land_8_20_14_0_80_50_8]|nr:MAG: hypothetical protein AUJ71_00865 [Candidatus Omnitrophica bacterium CG1_02_49_16]PIU40512.1 MAG: hypothetical protein COT00_01310 [Candidatus Omnitrophica bacterium CG07_land_8_20_14_0_80_50_8]